MPHTDSRPRLYFEVHGAGEPILLITGFGLLLDAAGSTEVRWIVYDHPGRIDTQSPPEGVGR
jgi:hypothetical protein